MVKLLRSKDTKVKHPYFTSNEYFESISGEIYDENGYCMDEWINHHLHSDWAQDDWVEF